MPNSKLFVAFVSLFPALALAEPPRLAVRIDSVTYATRVFAKGFSRIAMRGSKLLVVRYNVRNVSPAPLDLDATTLSFAATDPKGRRYRQDTSNAVLHGARTLASGESVDAAVGIEIPNDLSEAKIEAVEAGQAPLPLESGKPKPGRGTFFDKDGIRAFDELEAKRGERYEFGSIDLQIDDVTEAGSTVGSISATDENERLVTVDVTAWNVSDHMISLQEGAIFAERPGKKPGERTQVAQVLIGGTFADVNPGAHAKVRLVFRIQKDQRLGTIRLIDTAASRRSLVLRG